MRRLLGITVAGCGVALVAFGLFAARADQPEFPNNLRDFMQLKLKHSQLVLEGIVMADFDRIAKNAQQLSLLSQATNWQVLQTPDYLQHSTEFRRAADALTAAAKKKNIDGAALAYMEVTMKCVNCHKYVRAVRMASLDEPPK